MAPAISPSGRSVSTPPARWASLGMPNTTQLASSWARVLAPAGRLCVITFHSLEDRIVKRFMRDQSKEPEQYRGMPEIPEEFRPPLRLVGRPVTANDAEIDANVRARSARLRIAERAA